LIGVGITATAFLMVGSLILIKKNATTKKAGDAYTIMQ